MSSPVTMSGGRGRRTAAMRAANISVNANSSVGSGNTVTVGSNIGNSSSTSKGGNATAKGGNATAKGGNSTSTSKATAGMKEPIRKMRTRIIKGVEGGGRGTPGIHMAGGIRQGMSSFMYGMRMMGGMAVKMRMLEPGPRVYRGGMSGMRGTMRNNRGGGPRMNMRTVYYRSTAMTNRRRNVMSTNRGRRPMMRSR